MLADQNLQERLLLSTNTNRTIQENIPQQKIYAM